MIITEEVYVKHYGTKGMKWGVRRNRRADRLAKVGRGEASKTETVRALASVSISDLARGRGVKGAAKRRSDKQKATNARVQSGKASIRDKMRYYGGTRIQDLTPSRTNKKSKTSSKGTKTKGKMSGGEKAAIGALGAAFVVQAGLTVAARELGK